MTKQTNEPEQAIENPEILRQVNLLIIMLLPKLQLG